MSEGAATIFLFTFPTNQNQQKANFLDFFIFYPIWIKFGTGANIGKTELQWNLPPRDPAGRESAHKGKVSIPISHFPINIGYKRISVYEKQKAGPMKSLGAKFHCI